jgi:deoxycytidine triphosphate deaminase
MSLLSNTEIRKHIFRDREFLSESADGDRHFSLNLLQPASIDVTVGEIFLPPDAGDAHREVIRFRDHHMLSVGSTVLIRTEQSIRLPADIGGFVFPKNGHFALKGILITNFGHIDPGYEGYLKFTVINMGREAFRLEVGAAIACVVLFELSSPAVPDWKSQPHARTDDFESHAKILARDFMDVEQKTREIAKEQAKVEWQTRERTGALISILGAIVAGLLAIAGILFPVLWIGYDKIMLTNMEFNRVQSQFLVEQNKLQSQIDELKGKIAEFSALSQKSTGVRK